MIKKVTLVDVNNEVVYPKTSSEQVDGLQTAIDNSSVDNFYDTITTNNKASQELQTQITDMSNDTINDALNPDGVITTAINTAIDNSSVDNFYDTITTNNKASQELQKQIQIKTNFIINGALRPDGLITTRINTAIDNSSVDNFYDTITTNNKASQELQTQITVMSIDTINDALSPSGIITTAIANSSVDNFHNTIVTNNKASQELQTQITNISNDTINDALNPDGVITTAINTAIDNSSVDNFYNTITTNNKASQELQTQITDMSNDTINDALSPGGIITTAINEAVTGVSPSLPQNKLYRHNIEFYINSKHETIHLSFITSYSGQINTIQTFREYILNYTNNEIPINNDISNNKRFHMFKFYYDSDTNRYYIDALNFSASNILSMLTRLIIPESDIRFISDQIKEV